MKKLTLLVALAALSLGACTRSYQDIGPNDIGMMLTPTGYEDKIYTPGQVDIGQIGEAGKGNSLILIQRSGIQVKESFLGAAANDDHEDHRCLTGDGAPVTLDVRLLFALPDYKTPQGMKDLQRIFMLGNPTGVNGNDRVQRISAASIYDEQAKQAVRGKIRQLCASYPDFNALNAAFASGEQDGLVKKIEGAVSGVLGQNNVPLHLVSAYPSNLKPDPSVINAIVLKQALAKQNEAIKESADFIAADPTGSRRLVYQMQATQELVARANANGHNTVILSPGASAILGSR